MLIPFPIALWIFSFLSDVIVFFQWGGEIWHDMAFYTMIGGTLGALAAAVPGYIDYRSLIDPRIKKIGYTHMLLNLSIVGLYAVNLWLRTMQEPGALFPIILSAVAVSLLGISGWLGGELVYVHGVAVEAESIRKKI
jgi:uncharacterized membrane protein